MGALGYEVKRKKKPAPKKSPMALGLGRFYNLQLPIHGIIDVGAARGTWSIEASHFWPNASYLLMEPLKERQLCLEALTKTYRNFSFAPYAAGNKKTTIEFVIADDLDGSGIASSATDPSLIRSVPVVRIDDVVNEANVKGPYIIKLDTHGFEVPILEGCSGVLENVDLFIIECYGFQIVDNSLLFWQMCEYMQGLGYRLFDMVDVLHRPTDNAFWQCDAFFIKQSSPVFNSNSYK